MLFHLSNTSACFCNAVVSPSAFTCIAAILAFMSPHLRLHKELIHEWSHLLPLGKEKQVSPADDVESRMGDQARHESGIDRWNDRVVVACYNQCWLADLMEPGQAGPAHTRQ